MDYGRAEYKKSLTESESVKALNVEIELNRLFHEFKF